MSAEYQRLRDAASEIDREIATIEENQVVGSAMELATIERRLNELSVRRAALSRAMLLVKSVGCPKFRQRQQEFVRQLPRKYHCQGLRRKTVRLSGGVEVVLNIAYYHQRKDLARSSRKGIRGLFPALMLLGISSGLTPVVRQRMAKASSLLGSFEEAREMLSDEGIDVSVNKLREVCGHIGQQLSHLTRSGKMQLDGTFAGRRVVVSLDGGRVRLREPRKGRTKKGRKKFSANWREPRLFIIYAVDDEGRMANDFPPIIDGTLMSCDRLFDMLRAYLVSLTITEASKVVFVADGAAWIWRRIPKLIRTLELREEQVQQRIDFWHAVEYLGKIADSVRFTTARRRQWITIQKKRLLRGEIGSVVDELESLLSGHRTKEQTTWLNYFRTHGIQHRRMDYSQSPDYQTPIGSGAVESAIRRVINLRVKSNSTYWLRENAETMIRLRAWLKAGRSEELFRQTTYASYDLAI